MGPPQGWYQLVMVLIVCRFGCGLFAESSPSSVASIDQLRPQLDTLSLERLPAPLTRDQSSASKLDGFLNSTCQLMPIIHLLNQAGCEPKAIASFACSGACNSYVQVSLPAGRWPSRKWPALA